PSPINVDRDTRADQNNNDNGNDNRPPTFHSIKTVEAAVSAANLRSCSVCCLGGETNRIPMRGDSAHYFTARTNSVNSLSSAWFKSDTAQYFISLLVQEKTLYPRRVITVGEVLRLVGSGVMNKLIGCLFRW